MSNWREHQKNNPYFCILPFTHMHIGTDAAAKPCCVAEWSENICSNVSGMTFDEIWTSESYRQLRQDMLDYKPVAACAGCYKIDREGGGSDRQTHNTWFKTPTLDWDIDVKKGNTNGIPSWMDLRPGRFCNLGCRMCAVSVSSTYAEEHQKYPMLSSVTDQVYYDLADWIEDEDMYRSLQEMIPNLDCIKLAGGEPLFMPGVIKLLNWCVESGNTHVRLDITTNGTRSKGKVISWLEKFRRIDIQYSIDGIGYVNDYIRHPSDWKTVESNLHYYNSIDSVKTTNILATVQAYNAYDLPNIFDFWKEHGTDMLIFNLVNWPGDMSVDILPLEDRLEIAKQLEERANTLNADDRNQSRIDATIYKLRQEHDNKLVDELRSKWAKRTQMYDEIRNQDVGLVHPKLKEYVEQWLKIKTTNE